MTYEEAIKLAVEKPESVAFAVHDGQIFAVASNMNYGDVDPLFGPDLWQWQPWWDGDALDPEEAPEVMKTLNYIESPIGLQVFDYEFVIPRELFNGRSFDEVMNDPSIWF